MLPTQASGLLAFLLRAPKSRARVASDTGGHSDSLLSLPEDQPGLPPAGTAGRGHRPCPGASPQTELFQERFSCRGRLRPHELGPGTELACLVMGRAGQGCQDLAGLSLFF